MCGIEADDLEYDLYNPQSFVVLRRVMEILNNVTDPELIPALEAVCHGFPALRHLARITRQKVKRRQEIRRRHEWFDAFRIMKLLHHLRDGPYPSIPWREAVAGAPFVGNCTGDAAAVKERLEAEERRRLVGREFGLMSLV